MANKNITLEKAIDLFNMSDYIGINYIYITDYNNPSVLYLKYDSPIIIRGKNDLVNALINSGKVSDEILQMTFIGTFRTLNKLFIYVV